MKKEEISKPDWELLTKKYSQNLKYLEEKLNQNYPVQYLIGYVDFYDCYIKVDERVLIPRFETESLVDKLLTYLKKIPVPLKILDLGCGSGCISIALKKNIPCEITAIDKSKEALTLAKENAKINHTNIKFLHTTIEQMNYQNYNIIVSNPPYVSINEPVDIKTKYEPQEAIFAKNDGLYYYYTIIDKIAALKTKPILIAFEIGMNENEPIKNYAKQKLNPQNITIDKDLTGKNRYIFITV